MTDNVEPQHRPLPHGHTEHSFVLRAAATAGIIGPVTLALTITGLTLVQYEFMRELGWHPINAPTLDWPSGLALGPYGGVMIAAFVVSGGLLALFSAGLHTALPDVAPGPTFLGIAGVGMVLMSSKVDPSYRTYPATVHGILHDAAFAVMGVGFLLAFLAFAYRWRHVQGWQGYARYSWISALIVVPALVVKGWMFYFFLLNTLAWVTCIALRLRRLHRS